MVYSTGGREASGPPPYLNATSANGTTDSSTTANATTAESPAPDPSASPAVGKGASACPAALLPYLKQQQQPAHNSANTTQDVNGSAVGTNDTSNNATQQHGSRKKEEKAQEQQQQPNQGQKQQLVPAWPPPALKQGLTCTMEVSWDWYHVLKHCNLTVPVSSGNPASIRLPAGAKLPLPNWPSPDSKCLRPCLALGHVSAGQPPCRCLAWHSRRVQCVSHHQQPAQCVVQLAAGVGSKCSRRAAGSWC